jgi:hypothetical protein
MPKENNHAPKPSLSDALLSNNKCKGVNYHISTQNMKITVSISKDLFESAERFRQRTQKSRSRLWRDALTEYLARHTRKQVTAAMNKALQELATTDSGFISASARRVS